MGGRMNHQRLLSAAAVCFIIILAFDGPPGLAQHKPQEEVTVTAVEIPVRVLLKGQPVRDLTIDDFEVYENGVLQKLTHVEIVSKRITSPENQPVEPSPLPAQPLKPRRRVFLLILSVFDYTEAVGEAVDYLFGKVFRPGDRIMVVSEVQVLNADPGQSPGQAADGLKKSLKQFKSLTAGRTQRVFRNLRYEADRLILALEGFNGPGMEDIQQLVTHFVQNYRTAWTDYCAQYLKPDAAIYEKLVGRVRSTEGDAWAICLQQREMFPQMKNMTRLDNDLRNWLASQTDPQDQIRARIIVGAMDEMKREFNVSNTVPAEALREIFLRAGMPFHLVLMKSHRILADEDFELQEVGQDYEDALKQVSRATGGYLAFNNNPLQALQEAGQVEDYHYVLVYAGNQGTNSDKRELKVKVRRDGVEVISLKTYLPPPPVPIAVTEVKVEKGMIAFTISRYRMTGGSDGRHGRADVRLTIYDSDGKAVFDEGRVLDITKKETRIRLDPRLGRGDFFLTIRVIDLLANQSDTYSGPVTF
jgi:hypothetical protein